MVTNRHATAPRCHHRSSDSGAPPTQSVRISYWVGRPSAAPGVGLQVERVAFNMIGVEIAGFVAVRYRCTRQTVRPCLEPHRSGCQAPRPGEPEPKRDRRGHQQHRHDRRRDPRSQGTWSSVSATRVRVEGSGHIQRVRNNSSGRLTGFARSGAEINRWHGGRCRTSMPDRKAGSSPVARSARAPDHVVGPLRRRQRNRRYRRQRGVRRGRHGIG